MVMGKQTWYGSHDMDGSNGAELDRCWRVEEENVENDDTKMNPEVLVERVWEEVG